MKSNSNTTGEKPNTKIRQWLFGLCSLLILGCGSMKKENSIAAETSNESAYKIERIEFKSSGQKIVGILLVPNGLAPKPAVVIIGPVAYVKEQSPIQYATRMAKLGFVSLVFDPRNHGESEGEPRRWESGTRKVQDLNAAFSYLVSRDEVDKSKVSIIGVCQGVNWAVQAFNETPNAKSLALVAGHYLMPETALKYLGSKANVDERIDRAKKAKNVFEKTGQAQYIPIIGNDSQALLLPKPIHEWYSRWEYRGPMWSFQGQWENRITAMSELEIWGHDIRDSLKKVDKPILMIHSDLAASGPKIPKDLFAIIPSQQKELTWLGTQSQFQHYEDPITIDKSTQAIAAFFQK